MRQSYVGWLCGKNIQPVAEVTNVTKSSCTVDPSITFDVRRVANVPPLKPAKFQLVMRSVLALRSAV